MSLLNSKLESHRMCIEDYVEVTGEDRKRIFKQAKKAIEEYNLFYYQYQKNNLKKNQTS